MGAEKHTGITRGGVVFKRGGCADCSFAGPPPVGKKESKTGGCDLSGTTRNGRSNAMYTTVQIDVCDTKNRKYSSH